MRTIRKARERGTRDKESGMNNLVVIGGSDAGISAALTVKELDPSITPTVICAVELMR